MLSARNKRVGERLREPFGKAGLTVAVIALVFAMLGGAYAASNEGGGKATASAKAKAGPRGPRGKTGPAGPAGPAGAKGDTGAAGSNGTNGKDGTNGSNGVSAEATSFAGEKGSCKEGGLEVKSAKPVALVCNGKAGTTGFTKTLPSGETETGAWSMPEGEKGVTTISFPIPLSSGAANSGLYLNQGFPTGATPEEEEKCPGSAEEPKAKAGFLCIYTAKGSVSQFFAQRTDGIPSLGISYGKTGSVLIGIEPKKGEGINLSGSVFGPWAVTAP
jgi:Collagen triple helix repeat (20 copies)